MDDPNIIATLIATKSLTERAFEHKHNKKRYRAPTSVARPFSRQNTPYEDPEGEDRESDNPKNEDLKDEDETAHRLKLSFDRPPKDVSYGYVFGRGPDCDIQLVAGRTSDLETGRESKRSASDIVQSPSTHSAE